MAGVGDIDWYACWALEKVSPASALKRVLRVVFDIFRIIGYKRFKRLRWPPFAI
jgi:hypothetical protein